MKRVVALVYYTVLHRRLALVWYSLRKRVDWVSQRRTERSQDQPQNKFGSSPLVCKLPTSQQMTLHRYWFS